MAHELRIPEVGESIREVQIARWLKPEGSWIEQDEAVLEIESEKATVDLPAPAAGRLVRLLKHEGDAATVGEVVGYIDESLRPAAGQPPPPAEALRLAKPRRQESATPIQAAVGPPPLSVQGSPPTKSHAPDATAAAQDDDRGASAPRPLPPEGAPTPKAADVGQPRREEEAPMTLVRRRIAQRLVEAQQTAALLTTFNEVDMAAVIELRNRYREAFEKEYAARLGFMSFFVKASIEALKLYPALNAMVREANIVYRNYYDIGVAIAGGKILVTPVLRDADRMSFAEIERAIADFSARAAANRLKPDELTGGTFTITNGGVFGSLLSTPIVNPPQSGILGMHAIQDRPVARDGQVVIRPMMYLALTYDHRIVDGREAVGFLRRIKEIIEEPARLLLEV